MSNKLTPTKAKMELAVQQTKLARFQAKLQTLVAVIPELADANKLKNFQIRAAGIDSTHLDFQAALNRILELNQYVEEEEQITGDIEQSQAFEDLLYQIKEALLDHAPAPVQAPPAEPVTTTKGKPNLPCINIPTFDGTYEHFATFKSLFDALVHTHPTLTDIEKYSYLRSLLIGTALSSIQSFPFTEQQYLPAYQTLVRRFSNKRVIANNLCAKIFNCKPMTHEGQLPMFIDIFNVHVEAFKSAGVLNQGDFLLTFQALRLLDPVSRQAFEDTFKNAGKSDIPMYKDVLKFVQDRVSVTEMMPVTNMKVVPSSKPVVPKFYGQSNSNIKRTLVTNVTPSVPRTRQTGNSCPLCNKDHRIIECNQFRAMSVPERYNALRDKHLCFSCFGPHSRSMCSSKFACRSCASKSHHTMLHTDTAVSAPGITIPTVEPLPSSSRNLPSSLSGNAIPNPSDNTLSQQVLLGTALVSIADVFGRHHDVRILIDPGSMINIVTQSLRDKLCLPTRPSSIRVSGIGSGPPQPTNGSVMCKVNSKHNDFSINVDAVILPQIASNIPSLPVTQDVIKRLASVKLADPDFYHPATVQMLIGAQYYAEIMQSTEPIVPGHPSLVPSQFGTLALGISPASSSPCATHHSFFISESESDLSNQLRKFWEMEEVQVKIPMDPEDVQCEQHFVDTHYREPNGVYVVRLPFRDETPPDLGNNIAAATDRLLKLERRFEKQPDFKNLYHANLQDYVDSGHMTLAKTPASYSLTHHGVLKQSSTTRLRVVFNPAEKSHSSLPSLNESLLIGPKLQNNINDIILNFRCHPIVLLADIKQMYRGVKLDPRDWKYQQILWRFSPYEPIQTYEINRVCFGVSSSPFHALRVIKQLIKDEGDRFPAAAQVLDTDVYIDDVCTGASSVDEACQLRADLSALLGKAGFELRKWSSSHPSVLAGLDVDLLEKPHKFGDAETIQVLGIQWDSKEDVFCYQVETLSDCLTKRQVLSQIARMYDLPGFLGPVVIWMKILLQQVWLQGLGWDDPLPSDMLDQWNKFVSDMPCLRELKIPRYILDTYVYPPELIGFSDASSSAMAAVVYLRVVCSDQRVLVNLIRAKTKVAPVKPVTIPRLELTASYMLALLVESLQPFREQLRIETIKLFTDSMVVLSWLRTPPHLLKVFVANRVVKILDVTLPTQWSHVPTTENPADIASRGCFPSHLVQHDMWWHGPPFLLDDPASWPKCPQVVPTEPVPELKSPVVSAHVTIDNCGTAFLERFSSFTRAQRVIAWILRFKQN
uniref:Peptidase A2 domain-containing protein n=1 Tax=Cacopsylla melanoneura TaxID=428564 RepID=A0A8D8XPA3_9HEMI